MNKKHLPRSIARFIAPLLLAAVALLPYQSQAQQIGNYTNDWAPSVLTNGVATNAGNYGVITANSYSNVVGLVPKFLVRPGFGLGFSITLTNVYSTNVGAFTVALQGCTDGTNNSLGTNWTFSFNVLGTNQTFVTNLSAAQLDGYWSVSPYTISNADNTGVTLQHYVVSRPVPWNPSPRGY